MLGLNLALGFHFLVKMLIILPNSNIYTKFWEIAKMSNWVLTKFRENSKRAPSIHCSSIDEALSLSSRARRNKGLILFPSREPMSNWMLNKYIRVIFATIKKMNNSQYTKYKLHCQSQILIIKAKAIIYSINQNKEFFSSSWWTRRI